LLSGTILALMICLPAGGWWCLTRPYRSTEAADVCWEAGGEPGVVTFTVVDANGRPMPGIHANTASFSGWTSTRDVTDATGVLRLRPGELEVIAIKVEDVNLLESRDLAVDMLTAPSVANGLLIKVRVKDPSQLQARRRQNSPS
jgi:hypothetical protein